jgi:hypothetical protein
VDVLGFKDVVRNIAHDAEQQKKFLEAYLVDALEKTKQIQKNKEGSNIELEINVLSDTFFFSIPSETNGLVTNLAHMSVAIGFLQAYLCSRGMWTRGAITYGELVRFKNNIVGPALIDSFLIEQSDAVFPRVVLDTRINKYFRNSDDMVSQVNAVEFDNWIGHKIFCERHSSDHLDSTFQDDLNFVDYFNAFLGNEKNRLEYLSACRHLESGLQSKPDVYKKHKWTQRYFLYKHFSIVNGMGFAPVGSDDLSFFSTNAAIY